jgi:hypothetical protein
MQERVPANLPHPAAGGSERENVSITKAICKLNVKYLIFDKIYEINFAAWLLKHIPLMLQQSQYSNKFYHNLV